MAFDGTETLKGVDFDLWPGEVHGLIGENGAGKSTLAKIAAGVYRPLAGTIERDGRMVEIAGPARANALGIALIHQEPQMFPDLTVTENVFIGHHPRRALGSIDWKSAHHKASEILEGLGAKLNVRSRFGSLSVADQQMVELAVALSNNAKVLLLDETTASLTPKETESLFKIVRGLRDQGCAIAFVSHRLDEVFSICDRITVLRDGSKVGERKPSDTSVQEIISLMVGRELASSPLASLITPSANPILELRGLSLAGRFRDVSLQLRAGEIVAMAGLVGAGRTDVARTIFGIDAASGGAIHLDGKPVRIRSPRHATTLGIALVPEDRQHHGLLMPLSVQSNATLAALKRISPFWLRRNSERARTDEYVASLGIRLRATSQAVKELSGGNQQKVVLAKWLLTQPKVLILDEPTRGVDVGAKAEVHRLMRELAAQGMAILMISSDLPEVLAMGNRILVMREGRLVAEFGPGEADSERVMLAATGQEAHAV